MNIPEGFVLVPADPIKAIDMGWAYLDAAREAEPGQNWAFSHAGYRAMIAAAPVPVESTCRTDGRCEHAIQVGAEGNGHCPDGKCAMPHYAPGAGSDTLDCILGVGGFASFGPLDAQPAAHLTIPGALEWDGDNGTHGADGESGAHGESAAAITTLKALGYTHNGGTHWKPPVGQKPEFDLIDSLRSKLATEERQHLNTVDQRDRAETMADKLAQAVCELFRVEVGEHSSMNCPWTTALEILDGDFKTDSDQDREITTLRSKLANTEQSRRSFFDLSQDLEKRLADLQVSHDQMRDRKNSIVFLQQKLAERDALLAKCKDWIEAARDGVLYPIANEFQGVVGHNAEGLGQQSVALLDALSAIAEPAPPAEEDPFATEGPYVPLTDAEIEAFTTMGSGNKAKRRIAAIEKAKPKTCTACDGWGTISTGIDEAPSTNCKKCDGTGKGGDQ